MAITVSLRGTEVQFPDDATEAEIKAALDRDFPRNGEDVKEDLQDRSFKPSFADFKLYQAYLKEHPALVAQLEDGGAFLKAGSDAEQYATFLRIRAKAASKVSSMTTTPPANAANGSTSVAADSAYYSTSTHSNNASQEHVFIFLTVAIIVVGGIVALVLAIRSAFRMDKTMRERDPTLKPYRWGFFQGKGFVYIGWCFLIGLLPLFAVVKSESETFGLLFFEVVIAVTILAGHGVASRKKWGWVLLILFVVHLVYAVNRWREFSVGNAVTVSQAETKPLPIVVDSPATPPTTHARTNDSDDAFYAQAGAELRTGHVDDATWARALALTDGSESRAKSLYVKLRVEKLLKNLELPTVSPMLVPVPLVEAAGAKPGGFGGAEAQTSDTFQPEDPLEDISSTLVLGVIAIIILAIAILVSVYAE